MVQWQYSPVLRISISIPFSGLAWQSSDQTEDLNLAWTGMVENENEAVRDRLGDLERKVHMQNDEIVCLKATLADCLRRLNTLEVDKVRWGSEASFVILLRHL